VKKRLNQITRIESDDRSTDNREGKGKRKESGGEIMQGPVPPVPIPKKPKKKKGDDEPEPMSKKK
jgi:hypothetical protein